MHRGSVLSLLTSVAVLVPALSPRPLVLAGDVPTPNVKEDADNDYVWHVPEKWELSDPNDADQIAGFVAKATRTLSRGVVIDAFVRVRSASTETIDAALTVLKDAKSKGLAGVSAEELKEPWAGSKDARGLKISGRVENGTTIVWIVHAAVAGGRYHELSVRAANGAEQSAGAEITAAVEGYRILSNGGAAPAPGGEAPKPEGGEGGKPEGGAKPDGQGGGAPDGGSSKPQDNGRTRKFPQFGLEWTLPDRGHENTTWGFLGEGKPDLQKGQEGELVLAGLDEGGAPGIRLHLQLPKAGADPDPSGIVHNETNFKQALENFDGVPAPEIVSDAKIGNAKGASYGVTGKSKADGKMLTLKYMFVTLDGVLFEILMEARDNTDKRHAEWLRATLDGLHWADTASGVRAPLAMPIPTAAGPRKDWMDFGKKRPVKAALSYTKPPQMGEVRLEGQQGWRFAGEVRKESAYLFVGILRYDVAAFQQSKPVRKPESLIDDIENDWNNNLDQPVTRPKSDKANKKPDTFKGQKGFSYEFQGLKGDYTFVERGWLVTAGTDVFVIRVQYAGKDKDVTKVMEPDWKEFYTSMRFE